MTVIYYALICGWHYQMSFIHFALFQTGVLVSYVVWSCSWNFTIFVIARIIGGLCKGNVTLSTAIVTDVTSVKNRGKGMVRIASVLIFRCICTCSTTVPPYCPMKIHVHVFIQITPLNGPEHTLHLHISLLVKDISVSKFN